MKRLCFFLFILIVSISFVKAQKPITLNDDSVKFGNRYFPGIWLNIPEAKAEQVRTNWIKAIEKGTKSKVTVEKNEMTLFGANIPDFYAGSINIMSKIADRDSIANLFVSVETKRDVFVVPGSDEYEKLTNYLKKFGKEQYVKVAKEQLAAEEAKLSTLEKNLKAARKEKEKFDKSIQSSNIAIVQANDEIKRLNKELESTDAKIEKSTSSLSGMTEGDAKKAKEKELKDLQKKKKSALKGINTAENNISKANIAIDDNTKSIELNTAKQNELLLDIDQQKIVVSQFQEKLLTIQAY